MYKDPPKSRGLLEIPETRLNKAIEQIGRKSRKHI